MDAPYLMSRAEFIQVELVFLAGWKYLYYHNIFLHKLYFIDSWTMRYAFEEIQFSENISARKRLSLKVSELPCQDNSLYLNIL